MKIYISGKITGNPKYKKQFALAERELKARGYETVNPARLCDFMPASTTYSEYMRVCFLLIEMCDAVFLIGEWIDSKGAKAEFTYAHALGKKVYAEYDDIENKGK